MENRDALMQKPKLKSVRENDNKRKEHELPFLSICIQEFTFLSFLLNI